MNDVLVSLGAFISTYGEGEHTSKEIFNYGKAKNVALYQAMVKHAERGGRGKFKLDNGLVEKLTKLSSSKNEDAVRSLAKKEAREKESVVHKAEREAARLLREAARISAKADRAASIANRPKTVKAATVRAATSQANKDKRLATVADSGGAVLEAKQLGALGYTKVSQVDALISRARGGSVYVVDTAIGSMATPPIESDLNQKSATMEFYTKEA